MWLAAIAASVLCVGALVYALVTDWNATPEAPPRGPGGIAAGGGGLGLGIGLGIGAGIVIGSLIAARKKS
jgi:hypothetical protein